MLTAAIAFAITQAVSPAIVFSGQRSEIKTPAIHLVSNEQQWSRIWHSHAGMRALAPKVDFTNYVVLATFNGTAGQVAGYEAIGFDLQDGTLHAKIRPAWYSTGGGRRMTDEERQRIHSSTAYGFFVLKREFSRIVVEEQILAPKNEPASFKLVFDAKLER